jgi:hypothetical protein
MSFNTDQYRTLIQLVLPKEVFDYFNLLKLEVEGNKIHAYLDEQNIVPDGYEKEKLISKGFHSSITIQDFPIRDKPLFLHVRRRRWQVESTGAVISMDWDTVAKGTRLTKDFATFLKGILG